LSTAEELLARLGVCGQGWGVGGRSAEPLTWEQISSLAPPLNTPEGQYCRLRYLDDQDQRPPIERHIVVQLSRAAASAGWRVPRGEQVLRGMARLALLKRIGINRCRHCKGRGITHDQRQCKHCKGTGDGKPMSIRQEARTVGMDHRTWQRTWRVRFIEAERIVARIENKALEHIERKWRMTKDA
jgi:hypothetical protein